MSIALGSVGIMGYMRSGGVGREMRGMGREVRGLVLVGGFEGLFMEYGGGLDGLLGGDFYYCLLRLME